MKVYSIPKDLVLQELQKIPSMENYEGVALATIDGVIQHHEIDVEKVIAGKAVVFNSSHSIFLFNCAHRLWQDKTYKRQIEAGELLTQGVEKIIDDSIEKYFDGNFVMPQSKPVVEPDPQPDPQEVAKEWYPMDELPDNGE